jgi:hypothetical protein
MRTGALQSAPKWGRSAVIAAALLAVSAPYAHAALGGSQTSVEQDRAHLAARALTTTNSAYSLQILSQTNGDVVREFMNPDGVIFAVTWQGPARPDLQQLLGDRFATLQADNAVRTRRARAPMTVNRSDFVVHAAGHSGAFWGMAYLPQALPSGFDLSDLKTGTAP